MKRVFGAILATLGGMALLGSIPQVAKTDWNSSHDVSKFIGGAGLGLLLLVIGISLLRRRN